MSHIYRLRRAFAPCCCIVLEAHRLHCHLQFESGKFNGTKAELTTQVRIFVQPGGGGELCCAVGREQDAAGC
jgi:hypothetical protein